MRSHHYTGMWAILILGCWEAVTAGDTGIEGESRAAVPSWGAGADIFFADAFAEGLQALPTASGPPVAPSASAVLPTDVVPWSQIVSADVLEDEIKTVIHAWHLNEQTQSRVPNRLQKQQYLRYLALLFCVISKYDIDMRWQTDAQRIWYDLLEKFDSNSADRLPGSSKDELPDSRLSDVTSEPFRKLMHEGRWQPWGTYSPVEPNSWSVTVHRPTIMKRLEAADRRVAEIARQGTWPNDQSLGRLEYEAHVVRLLARLVEAPGAPDANDDAYKIYSRRMAESADQILSAVQTQRLSTLQDATRNFRQSCAECHADYRS
ncbi:MAG: hypothetical protein O2931_14720 [Planctomycetota bacterium]|nr:hypothetical protein [Planctomycetota bacterium]MDA1180035.1 hypothetical protein [Planctomycetota bacterium]